MKPFRYLLQASLKADTPKVRLLGEAWSRYAPIEDS